MDGRVLTEKEIKIRNMQYLNKMVCSIAMLCCAAVGYQLFQMLINNNLFITSWSRERTYMILIAPLAIGSLAWSIDIDKKLAKQGVKKPDPKAK